MTANKKLARRLWRGRTNVDAVTIAAIEAAEEKADHLFIVTQGSYQDGAGDPNSGDTHAYGGVVDLRWCGHDACVRHLRNAGLWTWHRTPAQGPWPDHLHGIVVGHPYLHPSAQRQLDAARKGRNGLANNGPDDGPRVPMVEPVWPWPRKTPPALRRQLRAAAVAAELGDLKALRKHLAKAARAATLRGKPQLAARLWRLRKAYTRGAGNIFKPKPALSDTLWELRKKHTRGDVR